MNKEDKNLYMYYLFSMSGIFLLGFAFGKRYGKKMMKVAYCAGVEACKLYYRL